MDCVACWSSGDVGHACVHLYKPPWLTQWLSARMHHATLAEPTRSIGTVRLRRGEDLSFVSGADTQSTMNAVTLGYTLAAELKSKVRTGDPCAKLHTQIKPTVAGPAFHGVSSWQRGYF